MIKVTGPNPTTLRRRLEHHAQGLIPLAHALVDAILFGALGQDDAVHVLRQHKAGANSFSLTTADGTSYHFRSDDYEVIFVKDAFKHGEPITTIRTPEEAESFVARVVADYRDTHSSASA